MVVLLKHSLIKDATIKEFLHAGDHETGNHRRTNKFWTDGLAPANQLQRLNTSLNAFRANLLI